MKLYYARFEIKNKNLLRFYKLFSINKMHFKSKLKKFIPKILLKKRLKKLYNQKN